MQTQPILDIQNVTVSFDGFKALDGLNFSMAYGELRFLIGPNGAGKTSLLDIITGKTRPREGAVLYDGNGDIQRWAEHKRVQKGIGRKFQTPTIFPSLTVYENLEAAVGRTDSAARLMAPMSADQKSRVESILEATGLEARRGARAGVLAHGEKQWLEIGMLLIQEPKLLLLDEPIAGMTRRERDRTGEMLQEIAKERSVLVVEHDMDFVRKYATKVTVLHTGKHLTEGSVESVQNDPRVIEVYLGRKHEEAAH
ncbi:ABC transporter ATP-binding protein [Capsulimonas corticalis]|uniref:ABC transporter ATP-binding protein n=1 Tax=Capsulimonas corticalis TaxID=2219043 RepID=A0A402CRX9_9BACT|nr:urea ABC transporter ATP-binding protein UrtD [Capsulimonas corticalis]BDI28200.1 ABC transporter ATP-binding protein [Capsulimonas corticalis]